MSPRSKLAIATLTIAGLCTAPATASVQLEPGSGVPRDEPPAGPTLSIDASDGVVYDGCHPYSVTVTISDLPADAISWELTGDWIHNIAPQSGSFAHEFQTNPTIPASVSTFVDTFDVCAGGPDAATGLAVGGRWLFETCVEVHFPLGNSGYCPHVTDGSSAYLAEFQMREPRSKVVLWASDRRVRAGKAVRVGCTTTGETPTGLAPRNTVCTIPTWRVRNGRRAGAVHSAIISKHTGADGRVVRAWRVSRPGVYELQARTSVDSPYLRSGRSNVIRIRVVR